MNSFPSFDDINDPSPSLIFHHQESPYEDVPTPLDDILSNNFLLDHADFGGLDTLTFPPSQVPPQGGPLPWDVKPVPYITNFDAPQLPQPGIFPPIAVQPTFDGTYALRSHPSASHRAGSSSAAFDDEQQRQRASLFGIPDLLPLPTPSGPAPALASSSVNWTDPVSSVTPAWSTGAPTPIVRTWDATAAAAAASATPGASARASAEPRQVPVPRLSFPRRYPLVRVDDTIEWVRPDVMKMVVYFNFSMNAEDEAHEPWEPRV
jgi:hypothetical protein